MIIIEQVKELRTIANNLSIGHNMSISLAIEHFRKAADTIESLSSHLKAENMEQSEGDYGKSVLKIDTPKVCIDCPCHFAGESGMVICGVEKRELLSEDIETFKPDWCPLRESSEDCGEWTYCGDGNNLPEESGYYDVTIESKINDEVVRTTDYRCFHKDIKLWEELIEPEFAIDEIVIAWRNRPEPYHESKK